MCIGGCWGGEVCKLPVWSVLLCGTSPLGFGGIGPPPHPPSHRGPHHPAVHHPGHLQGSRHTQTGQTGLSRILFVFVSPYWVAFHNHTNCYVRFTYNNEKGNAIVIAEKCYFNCRKKQLKRKSLSFFYLFLASSLCRHSSKRYILVIVLLL